jgi:hypothetical protein
MAIADHLVVNVQGLKSLLQLCHDERVLCVKKGDFEPPAFNCERPRLYYEPLNF